MIPAIKAVDLVKRYKKANFNAVDKINLEVNPGEVYGFLGPNGAGKSTAINMFVTSLFPTQGNVEILGVDTQEDPTEIRRMIGVVYQKPSLDEKLTAEENLRSHAVLYELTGWSPSYKTTSTEYKERVEKVIEIVGLKDRMHDVVKTFSGGMKRRLDIAKALLHTPKVLFLDEPTTGIDPHNRREIWGYLTDLQKEDRFTIFLTTQYLEEAEICDRISIINKGKILVTDTPDNLKRLVGDELLYISPVNGQESELKSELESLNIEYQTDNVGSFVIDLGKGKAQKVISQIKTELDEISIKRPTLDDVFIKLTGDKIK
ncbi:ATP-binding cassette domain-containing protein [Candidatus Dojkabacteria bacterium]|uniref:ATP-binding cassette domain-containing protein n=1 Tax=Candidatus Dojkabacteria bacterium TaxID=2099670 RepID=A0A955RLL1_9BACT|nr:ATP-binding cassette domain-containing protein [Candidatus Dojkabacteria bacterium]